MRQYHPLTSHPLAPRGTLLTQPPPVHVNLDSPAIEVMTDLARVPAVTIDASAALAEAHSYMKARGVRSLFVLNAEGIVLGLITASDILGERPLRASQARGMRHDDLRVIDVMTPSTAVVAFHLRDVLAAKVGHVIASLREAGRHHALVVESLAGGDERICGIFSVTQIARQLGEPLQISEVATTFAEVEQALAPGSR
jgi:CBS-domain-containing membrane protein